MALDLITFADLYTSILRRVKGDPVDEETISKIKEIINTRNRKICARKKWKFLRVTDRDLTLPKRVTTGTVTFANGSRIVTGAGTAFSALNKGWWIKAAASPETYRIISVASATQVTISSNYVGVTVSSAPYKLFQNELALFPNLEDIDDIRIEGRTDLILPKGPAFINMLRQKFPDREGRPIFYTIEGFSTFKGPVLGQFILGYDFLGSKKTKAISFFPSIPDKDYTIHLPYKKRIDAMVNDADEPDIPLEHRSVLLNYCLSDWYASNDGQMALYYQRLGDTDLKDMQARYLDTDDHIKMYSKSNGNYSHSYLMSHSESYFDTEG